MRLQVILALALATLLTACGWRQSQDKPVVAGPVPADTPKTVVRCPVPTNYDDATLNRIQQALDALPSDSILRQVLKDYETERDNLRMCE
jgi:outer membrane lipopolysaccharide assembly protein LptE/RlpB